MKHLVPGTTIGFLICIAHFWQLSVTTGCASIVPPTGGDRDSLPPLLVSVTPPDSSKNFAGKRINFVFNEFVQIDNPLANLVDYADSEKQPEC